MQFQANDKQNQQTTTPTNHWVPTFGFEIKEGRKQTTNKDPATKYRTSCGTFESVLISGLLVVCLLAAWPEKPRHSGNRPEKAIGYLHLHHNIHKYMSIYIYIYIYSYIQATGQHAKIIIFSMAFEFPDV